VVTAKSVAGKLTQKIGAVTIEESSNVQPANSQQLSTLQAQAIGHHGRELFLDSCRKRRAATTTVIANDGTDGQ
jgi:hypothetical protein